MLESYILLFILMILILWPALSTDYIDSTPIHFKGSDSKSIKEIDILVVPFFSKRTLFATLGGHGPGYEQEYKFHISSPFLYHSGEPLNILKMQTRGISPFFINYLGSTDQLMRILVICPEYQTRLISEYELSSRDWDRECPYVLREYCKNWPPHKLIRIDSVTSLHEIKRIESLLEEAELTGSQIKAWGFAEDKRLQVQLTVDDRELLNQFFTRALKKLSKNTDLQESG
ncbi:hypothetical protein ACFL27_13160 [candidate division CSSED10-310 bacterium]|uniref:Uncharacterized protein n=1 Tax=candidate division CSSED10-310 bacterium TaxID=2855610 RepID=A0ABV6YY60_UNCC1